MITAYGLWARKRSLLCAGVYCLVDMDRAMVTACSEDGCRWLTGMIVAATEPDPPVIVVTSALLSSLNFGLAEMAIQAGLDVWIAPEGLPYAVHRAAGIFTPRDPRRMAVTLARLPAMSEFRPYLRLASNPRKRGAADRQLQF